MRLIEAQIRNSRYSVSHPDKKRVDISCCASRYCWHSCTNVCGDREVVNGDHLLEDVGDGSSHLLIHFAIEPLRAKQGHFLEGLSGIKEEAP